jgi:hypothetical protein
MEELTGDLRNHVNLTLKLIIIRITELSHVEREGKDANSYET